MIGGIYLVHRSCRSQLQYKHAKNAVSGGLARTGRKPGYPAGCGSEPLGERPGGRLADAVDGFEFRS